MSNNIGAHALYEVEELRFHVRITDFRKSYGHDRYEIEAYYSPTFKTMASHMDMELPEAKKWVNGDKLKILSAE
jgi:hypothetical protein